MADLNKPYLKRYLDKERRAKKSIEYVKRWKNKHPDRVRTYDRISKRRLRERAVEKISPTKTCSNCGCDVYKILEINHKNGGGTKEFHNIYHGQMNKFYRDIVSGRRSTQDLEIRCKICNILHDVESRLKIKGFVVKYQKV